jgi:hypothetical protein
MSGVNRNVLADIAEEGLTGEAAMAAMSPENLRAETGTAAEDKREEAGEKESSK